MRAIKTKHNTVSLISQPEGKIFNKIEEDGFLDVNSMSEQELHLANEMYKRNVLKKVRRENKIGFKKY
jgi:hypothetical protein